MLVTTIAITALVAGAVFGWRTLRGEPDQADGAGGSWNQILLVDRGTGAVTAVADDDLAVVAAQGPPTGRVAAAYVERDRLALVQAGQITLTALDDETPTVIPVEIGAVVVRLPIDDALWLAVGSASGGNVLLVDGLTGTTHDVASLVAPTSVRVFLETLRYDVTGTSFAMADANNFQTVVVHTDADPPVAAFFADQPVAVGKNLVVTSEVVGQQADLALVDPERKELAKVSGELPVGGLLIDDEVTVISAEGTIARFGKDDTEAERLGTVAVPAGAGIRWVRPTADHTRLVVFGDSFQAVVDLDGRTVFTTTFTTAVGEPTIDPGWSCLPIGGGDSYHSLIDLSSGEQLADLTGMAVTGTSADGCTVIGTRAGLTEVVAADFTVSLGQTRGATLAPDGNAVVVQTVRGETQFVPIENGAVGDPVDITALAPTNALVTFRDT